MVAAGARPRRCVEPCQLHLTTTNSLANNNNNNINSVLLLSSTNSSINSRLHPFPKSMAFTTPTPQLRALLTLPFPAAPHMRLTPPPPTPPFRI